MQGRRGRVRGVSSAPKRDELSLRTVLAFPNASRTGELASSFAASVTSPSSVGALETSVRYSRSRLVVSEGSGRRSTTSTVSDELQILACISATAKVSIHRFCPRRSRH